jgi:hypothetical protein
VAWFDECRTIDNTKIQALKSSRKHYGCKNPNETYGFKDGNYLACNIKTWVQRIKPRIGFFPCPLERIAKVVEDSSLKSNI